MSYEECEMLNRYTAPRAARNLRRQRMIHLGCRAGAFLAGLLIGLAL